MWFQLLRSSSLKRSIYCLIGLVIVLSVGCAPGDDSSTENPVPTITAISPTGKVSHLPGFTLTVEGTGFVLDSVIVFNGEMKVTQYHSATRLSCSITSSDIASVAATLASESSVDSAMSRDIPVIVRSPMPGGGDSNSVVFQVRDNHVFSTPVTAITGNRSYTHASFVVQEAGNICLSYQFYDSLSGVYAIEFLRSDQNGSGWGAPVRIAVGNSVCDFPKLILDSEGRLNIVFFAIDRLYYSRSTDNGASWSYPAVVSAQAQGILEPAFAIDRSGGLYIIWSQYGNTFNQQVWYSHSSNQGVTWSQPVSIFSRWQEYCDVKSLEIELDTSGGVYVVWSARPTGGARYYYTFFNHSINNGSTWQAGELNFGEGSSANLVMESSGRLDLIQASSVEPLRSVIILRQSANRGVMWELKSVVYNSGFSTEPLFKMDRTGNFNVIFLNDYNYYFTRSVDGGVNWASPIMLGGANRMVMSLDSVGNVYVASETTNPPRISVFSSK